MTVRLDGDVIRLEGRCRIEEAETLLALLLKDRARVVDLSGCGTLHAAIVQILLATLPKIEGVPDNSFLCAHVIPLLEGGSSFRPAPS